MNKTKTIYNTIRSVKFVLKPTVKQKDILESFFGLSRAIYNISLHNIKNSKFGDYEIQNGKNKGNIVPRIPSEFDLNNSLPKLKDEYNYLAKKDVTAVFSRNKGIFLCETVKNNQKPEERKG